MKTKLLSLTTMLLLSVASINAQKVWDMGTNTTLWPLASPNITSGQVVVDGLTEVSGGGTFGATGGKVLTWTEGTEYTSVQEFKGNGSSAGFASNLPTTRYFTFPVTGPTTIKVWFRVNGTGGRKCMISDGANLLGELTDEDANKPLLLSADYKGTGAGNIYIFANSSINYFKIETSVLSLGLDSAKSIELTNIYSNGKQVSLSNVKSATQVDVYSIDGALVKSLKTDVDTSFELSTPGIYIVKATSEEGSKTAKVIVK